MERKKVSIPGIEKAYAAGERLAMLTAYDYPSAAIADQAGIDIILIGDSLGMVIDGYDTTLSVTMEEIIYHTKAVVRAVEYGLVVSDMPFLSYQTGTRDAIHNAGRLLKEGGAEAVKLEGGKNMAEVIEAIVNADIPVMGHIGLTPQSIHRMGGYRVQGRDEKGRNALIRDAAAVEQAGAFAVVLEGIPGALAQEITSKLHIPTIGIGAGREVSGQVLVFHDLLGLSGDRQPTFVKQYAHLKEASIGAIQQYIREVKEGVFPGPEHTYK
ncbi:MAG: 3-methyl-2-oxobutanoate hydroxymethyltransferase [Deltaproteobacteria bacterium]|nr:3-methyl-2-oxobutanoate hydroxymethyltransferase [Deltaproteobacteria bacterium]MCL5277268.1 3-methyl-2-oxobutanoate hydroxymethyltransferase [Deltaproteobacteria bacterium]